MGHTGDTYEKYYTPTHIARDFQAIYFGTPSEEELIRSVASMGLSRDRRAPTELNDDQQQEVRNDPMLVALRQVREKYKQKLYDQGFRPLSKANGTRLHEKYEKVQRKIGSTYQKLHRIRLNEAIREFHDSIDTIEIARQLSGKAATEVLTLLAVEFELRERATVSGMMFKPVENDGVRVKFIHTLARLCRLQETRRPKVMKRNRTVFVVCESHRASSPRKKGKVVDCLEKGPQGQGSEVEKQKPAKRDDITEAQSQHLYPMVLPHSICLLCIGNEECSHKWRMRHRERRDVLNKHVDAHFRQPEYQREF
jgi:hypothetical protein